MFEILEFWHTFVDFFSNCSSIIEKHPKSIFFFLMLHWCSECLRFQSLFGFRFFGLGMVNLYYNRVCSGDVNNILRNHRREKNQFCLMQTTACTCQNTHVCMRVCAQCPLSNIKKLKQLTETLNKVGKGSAVAGRSTWQVTRRRDECRVWNVSSVLVLMLMGCC